MHEASKLMGLIVRKGFQCDEVCFSTIINGYCQSKNFDKVFSLFRRMSSKGL